jgi:2-isopropylmalate synthase
MRAEGMSESEPHVRIFDTTLRDGEQAPGVSITLGEKLEIAKALCELDVDVIEAGFPITSDSVFESVRAISRAVDGPTVCALARCVRNDVDRAAEALRDAPRKRIHVFLATSPIHREHKLRKSRSQVLAAAAEGVDYARSLSDDVEFSAEDASRTEPDFLAEVAERVIARGATTINIPDTVGYALPTETAERFRALLGSVRGADSVIWSVHCHDDLGLATANSVAAVSAGARQVECTINGLGERAGNSALEEVVMVLATRHDRLGVRTRVHTPLLGPTSRLVSRLTGFAVPPNKPVVGANAFSHESGIHQHGVLANRATYEVMRPEDVGSGATRLVLGKHSGRHALRRRLEQLGYEVGEESLDRVFASVKHLADTKKEIDDDDLRLLFEERPHTHRGT